MMDRVKGSIYVLLSVMCCLTVEASMDRVKEEASSAARQSINDRKNALRQARPGSVVPGVSQEDLVPKSDRHRPDRFNPRNAMRQAKACEEGDRPSNEISELLQSEAVEGQHKRFTTGEAAQEMLEDVASGAARIDQDSHRALGLYKGRRQTTGGRATHRNVTCREEGAPYELTVHRLLDVDVERYPEEWETVKVCNSHYDTATEWRTHGYAAVDTAHLYSSLEAINKEYKMGITKILKNTEKNDSNWFFKYRGRIAYWHKDNAENCDNNREERRLVREERFIEKDDKWRVDNDAHWRQGSGPDCTLVANQCVDAGTKVINGKQVSRPCWKQKLTFRCQYPVRRECKSLRGQGCRKIGERCISQGIRGCALWERTFQCPNFTQGENQTARDASGREYYCLDGECMDKSYKTNNSLAEVSSKVAVFDAMKKDMETGGARNVQGIRRVFGGKSERCKKNICENLMYDCCMTESGLMTRVGLAGCNEEEKALAVHRGKGQCHFVGSHADKILGLFETSNFHTYCCYPSKLVRVLQEEAHRQLGISWGSSESPNCGGLTFEEIEKLNFDDLDLSEVFEDMVPDTAKTPEKTLDSFNLKTPGAKRETERKVKERMKRMRGAI